MPYPLGYHITFGTYGARLHGSSKPHVDRNHNEFGAPFAPTDPAREQFIHDRMRFPPVRLTVPQRKVTERAISELCDRYRWPLHAIAPQSDHVHAVVTAPRVGEQLRDAIKAVASRALNTEFGKKTWWAEKGSAKYLWERGYFDQAIQYVARQRDF